MKVTCLILAGGRGTRLRPVTYFLHKTLLPLGKNKRVIDYVVESCLSSSSSVDTEIFVLANYKAGQLRRYLIRKVGVSIIVESKFLGTGGAILQNWPVIKETSPDVILVMPGDHYVFLPLDKICSLFIQTKAGVMLLCAKSNELHHDYLDISGKEVIGINKFVQNKSGLAFTGISLMKFGILNERIELLRSSAYVDLTKDIIVPLLGNYGGRYFVLDKSWEDIGTWGRYIKTLFEIKKGG